MKCEPRCVDFANGICIHCKTPLQVNHDGSLAPGGIPMLLWCPACGKRHIDTGEFEHKPHHTHACQHCGMVWRPAIVPTAGVEFLPGFKNEGGNNGKQGE